MNLCKIKKNGLNVVHCVASKAMKTENEWYRAYSIPPSIWYLEDRCFNIYINMKTLIGIVNHSFSKYCQCYSLRDCFDRDTDKQTNKQTEMIMVYKTRLWVRKESSFKLVSLASSLRLLSHNKQMTTFIQQKPINITFCLENSNSH